MARPGRPERNRAARSFRQLRRFHHFINSDKVFGTHSGNVGARPNMFNPPRDHRLLAVVEAIETIAPSGFAGIRAKARNCAINKYLVANGKDEASDSTILR